MNDADFIDALGGDSRDFDRALGWLSRRAFASPTERAAFVVSAIRSLASSSRLSGREIDRRCRLVFDRIRQDETLLRLVVAGVQGVQASALNAIRSALPSHLRPLAVAHTPGSSLPPSSASPSTFIEATTGDSSRNVSPHVHERSQQIPTVVLVGTEVEHAANKAMLNRNGFEPLRVATLDALWTVAHTGLCGFVVAPSAWSGLDEQGQRGAVDRLCSWSTFTFARLSVVGMADSIASQLPTLLELGLGRPSTDRFLHGSSTDLTAADITLLRASATLLATADETRFVPLDVSREEALLLRLIAGPRRPLDGMVEVRHLGAARMHGGRSNARVFMLQMLGESARRFVVKLDEPPKLRKELERHQRWIAGWEPNVTDPVIHHHEGRSAISYRLQAHADGADRPAPTLEGELERLRNMEWLNDAPSTDGAAELAKTLEAAIFRAAERLAELNQRTTSEVGYEFWLHWPATGLAARSISHELTGHDEVVFDLASIVKVAVDGLASLHDKGIVHGDIHGRNILLVDRLPAFIDFDMSGPGNPLVDLVRLDATVRHLAMRATFGEKALAALYVALYVDGTPAADLLARLPTLAASPACTLALNVAEKARTCALAVAESFGHGRREYLSMVAVIAAYMLTLRSPGSVVERALLAAIAPILMTELTSQSSSNRARVSSASWSPDPTIGASDA
jgi:Ser/Thr protein kinase RdoA (MazF antagonist)